MSASFLPRREARLHVETLGNVEARGELRQDLGYLVRRRVRASNLAGARRLLGGAPVSYTGLRGRETFRVAPGWERRFPLNSSSTYPGNCVIFPSIPGTAPSLLRISTGRSPSMPWRAPLEWTAFNPPLPRGPGGEIRLGRIRGAVRCLSGGGGIWVGAAGDQAVLQTAGGEVFVREASGPVFAATGGGNIEIQRALSLVNARTGGGLVSVNQASGMVRANTSGGAIRIGAAKSVHCESAAGAIELQSVSGALRASTLMGSILASIQDDRFEDSFLNTGAGDITVFLPSNLAVTVQADNEMSGALGRILSEFPEIRVHRGIWSTGKPVQAQGALNGGGPVLKLAAAGGIISLKRQK